jgi:hypothetical protein
MCDSDRARWWLLLLLLLLLFVIFLFLGEEEPQPLPHFRIVSADGCNRGAAMTKHLPEPYQIVCVLFKPTRTSLAIIRILKVFYLYIKIGTGNFQIIAQKINALKQYYTRIQFCFLEASFCHIRV